MNAILITVDCLRADHLSCMGYPRLTSPFIDSLAKKGVKFTHAIVNGAGTFASFTALMTSTYPFMKGTFERVNRKTLAEVLKNRGYVTAGINDNGFLSPYFGFDRGFEYFNCISARKLGKFKRKLDKFCNIFKNFFQATFFGDWGMNGKLVTKLAVNWIKNNTKDDFFLWIHYMDVHGPHYAPKRYYRLIGSKPYSFADQLRLNRLLRSNPEVLYRNGKIRRDHIDMLISTYDAEIRYVDSCVYEVYKTLEKHNILNKTYIILTGDHGEEFFEHGGYHSNLNLYDEMIRIPLIIYGPDVEPRVVNKQVRQIDISTTILSLLGEKKPREFLGKNLMSCNCGSEYVVTEAAYYNIGKKDSKRIVEIDFNLRKTAVRGVVDGYMWKYIYCTKTKREELYNLHADPMESVNLAGSAKYEYVLQTLKQIAGKHVLMEKEYIKIGDIARKLKRR